jgi:hypothetical protein
MKRTVGALIGVVALAIVLGACSSKDAKDAKDAQAPAATAPPKVSATPVPAPSGKLVLKLNGMLSNHNQGSALAFDQRTLDTLPTRSATLYEPFVKKDVQFTGIPMSELLGRAGISEQATKVQLHALDDYKVDFQVADLMAPGVLLATRADGAPIPIAKGGPVRLVFPPDSTVGKNKDFWIWSIDSITVS